MRWLGILLSLMVVFGGVAEAKVSINSQGTSGAPLSVSAAALVIPANQNRFNWTLYSESAALRCTIGTYSQASGTFTAPAITPTSSVGFYVPSGSYVNEKSLTLNAYSNGPNAVSEDEAKVEVDCISLSGSTNVDTWEELAR